MKPILNLNKHPKDCENLSLVEAMNVRLSNDGSCLQTEEKIVDIESINRQLMDDYHDRFNIIDTISCNKELIIFVKDTYNIEPFVDIYRYNEDLNIIKKVYSKLNYYNGEIKGTFTYNVHNELIIAFSEYNSDEDVPLRTINLGKFEDEVEQLPNELLPINPEIIIPTINYSYIAGNLPKGWYYIFIRYKIDNVDYTKWVSIKDKILLADIEKQNIFKYHNYYKNNTVKQEFSTGITDYFSTNEKNSKESISINLELIDTRYKKYQIAFVCVNDTESIAYRTEDINIKTISYSFDIDNMIAIQPTELIEESYYSYNIKNIFNYNNRLYIANYKEKVLEDYDTSKIKLLLTKENIKLYDLKNGIYEQGKEGEEILFFREEIAGKIDISKIGEFDTIIKTDTNINGQFVNRYFTGTNVNEFIDLDLIDIATEYVINGEFNKTYKGFGGCCVVDKKFYIKSDGSTPIYKEINFHIAVNKYLDITECYFKYIDEDNVEYITTCRIDHISDNRYISFHINSRKITKEILNKYISISSENIPNQNLFINTKNSFNIRKQNSTLIPGEIYNFYIHFVDKYGQETKGFRINNNFNYYDKYSKNNQNEYKEICPIKVINKELFGDSNPRYILVDKNATVFDGDNVNLTRTAFINGINRQVFSFSNGYVADDLGITFNDFYVSTGIENSFIKTLSPIIYDKIKGYSNIPNIKWYQVSEFIEDCFGKYTTANGEDLFKVPKHNISLVSDDNGSYYNFIKYGINLKNVVLPEGYVGYFISYEKFQSIKKLTGILTKYDLNLVNDNEELIDYNKKSSSFMNFYTSEFDIESSISLNYNILSIEAINVFDEITNLKYIDGKVNDSLINLNLPQLKNNIEYEKSFDISKYQIKVGGDVSKNRFGLGTVLQIPIVEGLFNYTSDEAEANLYRASLLFYNENLYDDVEKVLIKCSNVIYPNLNNNIQFNFNGYVSYNGFMVYNNNKFIYSPGDSKIYTENQKPYYGGDINYENTKPVLYAQLPVYKEYFIETKEFLNKPTYLNTILGEITDEVTIEDLAIAQSVIVEPQNTIDLFKNKLSYPDNYNLKVYQNYREDIKYLTQFDKIVRRSDVIQDESSSNAWRQFGLENYKVISENKGKITNIVGIGYYFIVHTEHSLFAFNNDNKLSALDKEIQLTTPDIFDIDYQEILTSNLGYGGLQNNDDWVLGTFGYIHYDKDSNRIFRFDNGKLDYIDNDIVQFLNKYKPEYIHFADDIKSNRLLLNININDINGNYNFTLSYNYGINKFISIHNYEIHKVANTKNNLYFVYPLYINKFDYNAVLRNEGYTTNDSTLSFIINERYQSIKYLEYIIYKLYNVKVNTDDYPSDNNLPPVEELRKPYSGEQIRVYNDEVDTGWLDINISKEESKNVFSNYDKPYWDKGNWNFSYLRDRDTKSRLYGNYFVVSIKFKGLGERIEFESLLYSISKDKMI